MPHLHHDDQTRHDGVLAAAVRLFAVNGYEGTTVPGVAKEARVGLGTLYRYYPGKQALVNGAYRHAKRELKAALLDGFVGSASPREQVHHVFSRVLGFASDDPHAFAFLELHHHEPYLDAESRAVELEVLTPILEWYLSGQARGAIADTPPQVGIALVWGALVGLIKAERAGYLSLDDTVLHEAEQAAWRAIALES
jgi:AcrR family transcriptional regulator